MSRTPDNDEREFPWWIAIVGLALFSAIAYFIYRGVRDPEKFIHYGAWGDFFGGTLNPILTFLTVIGLLVTIHLQQRELRLTRVELAKSSAALVAQNLTTRQQRFENSLFNMIQLLSQIVNAMDVTVDGKTYSGKDCFTAFAESLGKLYKNFKESQPPIKSFKDDLPSDDSKNYVDPYLKIPYDMFYDKYRSKLSHYFLLLFHMFQYIAQYNEKVKSSGESEQIYDNIYADMLRAQLSSQELLIIFYHNASGRDKAFEKLAEQFALYKHMKTGSLLETDHEKLACPKSFGES